MSGYSEVLGLLLTLAVFCLPSATTQSTCVSKYIVHNIIMDAEMNGPCNCSCDLVVKHVMYSVIQVYAKHGDLIWQLGSN